ncbi:MAG: SpoIID/LytB domain-containing protein, partial [Thermoanaerobaculia bacterium]
YGVVPSEMGPKRYDELEALKAQAVAARTYALAHRGQFEGEGYDICATAKCQVYAGLSAEDPLSNAAVDATRGLVLAYQGKFADALFVSTCGGRTENVENVFGETAEPYLVSVECGELSTTSLPGARVGREAARRERTGFEWRGYVLRYFSPRKGAVRLAALETAQQWAGVTKRVAAPASLTPAAVYPSILNAFELAQAQTLHLLSRDESYYSDPPAASGRLQGSTREAYDFLLRFRFGAGEALPAPERMLNEEEYAGLLFSAALRLSGVVEGSGKFLRREGSNLWTKTAEGRLGLPLDPEVPLARRVGDRFFLASELTLRPGDRLGWWKRGSQLLALWVELDPAGPSFERESAWTEWVRRVSGTELQRRMSGRVAGTEVRGITVTRRSSSGRAIEISVRTDAAEVTLRRFDLRQALGLPELLFTVERVRGAQGETEFVFLGRGWGHGVGLCQNGAYGMAVAGETAEAILKHYYTGIDIVPASAVTAGTPSSR